ncbi:chloride channel protein [Thiohalobacter thiocyanaticus]|uniref:Chloride channel protein n=1 Tax=Thiohalobacter thiocyanaticus TaxID=585455 RepID=A0A426QGR9_9GAMM|nr:chloride channel protein [Thiohalobacter thiocyanaticus]RRQ20951.1 chloride channel protein [Thiohalobacter thiocyanaticus]
MRAILSKQLERYRLSVARPDAVPQLALLGILAGVLAGLTIIAFRLLAEWLQSGLLAGRAGHFAGLAASHRLYLALLGGLGLGLLFQWLSEDTRRVGILHVLERLEYHQGRMPWRNALSQFLGGAVAIISGQSIGREGPSAHLGAASSNLPAQWLQLPNNSLRVTAACGVAAGIAASFNTPLAGVAFAMEVLMLEYTVAGFTPVILATVSATMLSRLVFGDQIAFSVPAISLGSLSELPYIMIVGILIGMIGAAFLVLLQLFTRLHAPLPVWLRFSLAGGAVGLAGMVVPQVMGIGDQTITDTFNGHHGLTLLTSILILKLLATTFTIGAGIPGGMIGPSLVIGAAGGGLLGMLGMDAGISAPDSLGLYVLVGMGAMMAAILQAPLAGLIAILELTRSPDVILPGMLAVVSATITAGLFTQRESAFHTMLRNLGMDYRNDPVKQSLRRVGVTAAMQTAFTVLPRRVERTRLDEELKDNLQWIVIREPEQADVLLAAVDLVQAVARDAEATEFDLMDIPGTRLQTTGVDRQASLQEAHARMQATGAEALLVTRYAAPGLKRVEGILTAEGIAQTYRL